MGSVKVHWLLASVAGFVLVGIGQAALGGHLSSILQLASFIIVVSTALGFLVAIQGGERVWLTMKTCFRPHHHEKNITEAIGVIDMLERTSVLGGMLGTGIGLVHVIANFHRPDLIGPGLAVSLVCLSYSLAINGFIALPAKQALLRYQDQNDGKRQKASAIKPILALLVAGLGVMLGAYGEGARFAWFISWPLFCVVAAPFVANWIAGRGDMSHVNDMKRRDLWYANALLCGGLLGGVFQVIILMENLDKAEQISIRTSATIVPLLYGAVSSIYFRLRASSQYSSPEKVLPHQKAESDYMAYAAFTTLTLSLAVAVVFFALEKS